jgi:thioredoxin 1
MATQLTDSNFKELVLDSDKVAIVDFWAEWCGPCKAIGPMIEELSKEYEGKAIVGKVDVDSNPETANEVWYPQHSQLSCLLRTDK